MNSTRVSNRQQFPFIIRALWFLLVGWYVAGLWIGVAWVLNVTIIGLPLGLWMLNRVPLVLTLRTQAYEDVTTTDAEGHVVVHRRNVEQHPFGLRALYFALVGWWLSLLWSVGAYLLCLTIIGLPFGAWMFNRLPQVTTLARQ